jgi:acetylornithine deacetylase/succinyl-diaminopimelate desuccinylase-like protein
MNSSTDFCITNEQFNWAIDGLRQFVSIPSVSNPSSPDYNMNNLVAASEFALKKLKEVGFQVRCARIENSAPFVIGKYFVNERLPTVVVYAHYDVQPVDREKWQSDPFIMEEREERYFGRGASDDKAGIMAALTAFKSYSDQNLKLPVNVTVLFEGEEEVGSTHMRALLQREKDLNGHALVVLDGMNRSVDTGTLTSSNRGLVNLTLEVSALRQPLHSGQGLLAPDPAQALSSIIVSLDPPENIPGIMDGAIPLGLKELKLLNKNSISSEEFAEEKGVLQGCSLRGNSESSVYERLGEIPNISIINMNCGKPNGGNSIQDKAICTLSIRCLPGQTPHKVAECIKKYIESQPIKWGLPVTVTQSGKGSFGWKGDPSRPFSQKYLEALQVNFVNTCVRPSGGSLPLLHEFEEAFPGIEVIVPGVEDPATNAHSHNESQSKPMLRSATNAFIAFLRKAGEVEL